jgi:hypothetical protein
VKTPGIDPVLQKAIAKLLKETMTSPTATLTDKCKAVDRALKLEAIKHKMKDDGYGSGFFDKPDATDE